MRIGPYQWLLSIAASAALGACSDAGFSGFAGKKKDKAPVSEPAADEPADAKDKEKPDDKDSVLGDPSINDAGSDAPAPAAAIVECLKQWKDAPFTPEQLANPTKINVDQSNNNNATTVDDNDTTPDPALVLITITSKNVNSGVMKLGNANGWYCVDLQSKAANNFNIEAHCDANIATLEHSEHVGNGFVITRSGSCD